MLRSEPRLAQDVLDELDRLDAALHADRHGANDVPPGAHAGTTDPATGLARDPAASIGRGAEDPDRSPEDLDALDHELLALAADVRATRPAFDTGTRMRLEARVQEAKAAPAPRARRFTTDRRWRAGLALAAVAAVAIPVGTVMTSGDGGLSQDLGGDTAPQAMSESSTTAAAGPADASDSAAAAPTDPSATTESLGGSSGTRSGEGDLEKFSRRLSPGSTTVAPSPPGTPTTKQAPLGAPRQVIRDVEQTVRINPGDVAKSAERVTTIVQDAGGYLGSSEVRERGSAAGGTFQVVVPTGRLDATVAALSRIGRPVRLERSSSDVTDQATSLDDQLKDLRADRAAARLALARTVDPDRRAARRRELTLLSSRVAGLQGQREQLRRQTSTSRIDLRLTTSKAAGDDPAPPVDDGSWGIGDAWDDAGRVLEVGGGVVLIGAVVLVPLAGLLGFGLVVRRRAAARGRDAAIDAT